MMNTYLFEYTYAGEKYGFEVVAGSRAEATSRLVAIRDTAQLQGEVALTIPAWTPASGVLARLVVWLRNIVGR
ncbi:MAG: hypothetical protein AAF662_08285 [Pseudomonadota bacterium]